MAILNAVKLFLSHPLVLPLLVSPVAWASYVAHIKYMLRHL